MAHKTTSRRRKAARSLQLRAFRGAQNYRFARTLSVVPRTRSAEIKMVDISNTTYTCNTTGSVVAINLIQAGSSFFNRVGRRIEMKSLHVSGVMVPSANATTANDYIRVMVVYDRQPNGAIPSIQTIFSNYDQTGAATFNSFAGLNPDQRERFLILMDERKTMPPNTGGGPYQPIEGNRDVFNIGRFIKMNGLMTHYQADSSPSVIGDISTGGLYLVTFGAFAAAGAPYSAHINLRLRYTDT